MPHSYQLFASIKDFFDNHIIPRFFPRFDEFVYVYDGEEVTIDPKDLELKYKFAIKYIRPVLQAYWNVKTLHYPLRYCIDKSLINTNKKFKSLVTDTLSKCKIHKRKGKPNVKTSDDYHRVNDLTGGLPMEVWDLIIMMGADPKVFIRVNTQFYNFIGPKLYKDFKDIQVLLVLTKTTKIRANDANFLKYGPDYPHKPCINGYEIFKRRKEGLKHDFEFLEVTRIYDTIRYKSSHEAIKHNTGAIFITCLKSIEFLFDHILGNEKSALKYMIQSVTVDISILDGFQEVMYQSSGKLPSSNLSLNGMIENMVNNASGSKLTKLQTESIELFATNLNDNFDNSRWRQDPGTLQTNYLFKPGYNGHVPTNEKFPQHVYFMELNHLDDLFALYIKHGKRKEMADIKSESELKKKSPFRIHRKRRRSINTVKNNDYIYTGLSDRAVSKSWDIFIQDRHFKSEVETFDSLAKIVQTLFSETNIKVSLLINGLRLTQEQVTPPESCRDLCEPLSGHKVISTLVNNHAIPDK
ncbi:hypothetical protein BN7_4083 [Wickerhamomyces ciferrii]|uniref:Uncharacterized protein n=1 Tax=Wickerhamomyces ciferrii (strain ATCC 14091 / BCRC 22168 / CBS 111 / JCM 3599 / NBRC 0793 / NRRL Y-1031 F-60-10) TaxID=1206466 RepID=K0KT88_WICCF|nr:uncharacterized protein BN7_4083 [Wickerhamomyces ciferrii]CCH44518.1 hypothetical protein BN7_4083 [Wickerhamomyces ciferrii]